VVEAGVLIFEEVGGCWEVIQKCRGIFAADAAIKRSVQDM
jgi:hypothetical protein